MSVGLVVELDKVITAHGSGNPVLVPNLTPSQPNEIAILVIHPIYQQSSGNCGLPAVNKIIDSIPSPWSYAGQVRDSDFKFVGNIANPFWVGYISYNAGPSVPPVYPFWCLTSSPIGLNANILTDTGAGWPDSWVAILALLKYTGDILPPIIMSPSLSFAFGTSTHNGWGGFSPTTRIFVISYATWSGNFPNSPVTLSDSLGNIYQSIAYDLSPSGSIPTPVKCCPQMVGTSLQMFICRDYHSVVGVSDLTVDVPQMPDGYDRALDAVGCPLTSVQLIPVSIAGAFFNAESVPPEVSCTMSASNYNIIEGQSTILTWTSINCVSAVLDNGIGVVNCNDSLEVSPIIETTYVLTVTGEDFSTSTCSVTITVTSPIPPIPPQNRNVSAIATTYCCQ